MKNKKKSKNLLKYFVSGVVFPTILLYALAIMGYVNFSQSGWLLPGVIIILGGILLIFAIDYSLRFLKKWQR